MMISVVRAKLVFTTNQKEKKHIGETMICRMLENNCFLMEFIDNHDIKTSPVKNFSQFGKTMTIQTLNSIYKLEIIEKVK